MLKRVVWTIMTQVGTGGGVWITEIENWVVDSCEVLIDDMADRTYCSGCLCVEGLFAWGCDA